MQPVSLTTDRLHLRLWRDEDDEAFATMNRDPAVMEFMPAPLTRAQSDELADRIRAHFDEHGYGLWAVEIPERDPFIGFIGFQWARFEAPFTPALEVGFLLDARYWNLGYATEGAKAALDFIFEKPEIDQVVSFTAALNKRSQHVIEKVGLSRVPGGEFDHPRLEPTHALCPHILFRASRKEWLVRR